MSSYRCPRDEDGRREPGDGRGDNKDNEERRGGSPKTLRKTNVSEAGAASKTRRCEATSLARVGRGNKFLFKLSADLGWIVQLHAAVTRLEMFD